MRSLLVAVTGAALALASFATEYTWTGAAGDGKWTSTNNWGCLEYPNADSAVVKVAGPLTIDLDGTTDFYLKRMEVTSGTVTLTGSSRLCFDAAYDKKAPGYTGFSVAQDAKLVVGVNVYSANRFDTLGKGSVEWRGTYEGKTDSMFLHTLTTYLEDGCLIKYFPTFGLGGEGSEFKFFINGSAQIDCNGSILVSSGSTGSEKGSVWQLGAQSSVKTVNNLVVNNQTTGKPQYYNLDNGYLEVGGGIYSGLASGGGDFTQNGGRSLVKGSLCPTYGNIFLRGGEMTVNKGTVASANGGSIFMSGGSLSLGGANSTNGSPFTVSGGALTLRQGLLLNAPITVAGGTVAVEDGIVCAESVKVVMDGGAYVVAGDCTWPELMEKTSCLDFRKTVRLTAASPVTVTVPADVVLPDGVEAGANVTLKASSSDNFAKDSTLVLRDSGRIELAAGATLENATLILASGEYTKDELDALRAQYQAVAVKGCVKVVLDQDWAWSTLLFSLQTVYDGRLTLFADGDALRTVRVAADTVLPDQLTIGANVKVLVAANVQMCAATDVPPALTIRSGGKFALVNQSAYIAAPIDLTIDDGGQLIVDDGGGASGQYARTILVAHSYTLNGVKKGRGKYSASKTGAFCSLQGLECYLSVPYTWTGEGDGTDVDDLRNWEDSEYSWWTSDQMLDFSRATGPITFGKSISNKKQEYVQGCIAYLPPATRDGSTVCLVNAEGADVTLGLRGPGSGHTSSLLAVAVCRKGCTIDFGINFRNYDGVNQSCWVGKGTYRFRKDVNLVGIVRDGKPAATSNYFCLDGNVEIAGTVTTTTGNLQYNENHHSASHLEFVDGANVDLAGVITLEHPNGFTSGLGLWQSGGNVTAKNVCMSFANRKDGTTRNAYHLSGGVLTLTESLIIGGENPLAPGVGVQNYGTFEMTGGSLVTPMVLNECNGTYCRLLGGDVTLGEGGFAKSTSLRAADTPNVTPPLVLGNVTLHATDASWAIAEEISVDLQGQATFDVAAGQTVTINSALSGAGGVSKTGAGALVVKGAYAGKGDLSVAAGTLAFEQVADGLAVETVSLCDENALSLPASAKIKTTRLIVGGEDLGKGDHAFGEGTVTVEGGCVWIGASGGRWLDSENWAGDCIPTATDVVVFPLSSGDALSVDVDGAAVARKLTVDAGRVSFTGTGAITFPDKGELQIAPGAELDFGATVCAEMALSKTGTGKVTFTGTLRCAADPASLVWQATNRFQVVQGEAVIGGVVRGLRVFADSQVEADMPKLTIAEGAELTDRCFVHGPWCGPNANGYGEVVMEGGTVDMTTGVAVFTDWGSYPLRTGDKYGFAYFRSGKMKFTLNGGLFRTPRCTAVAFNLNNVNNNGGEVTVTVNGGELDIYDILYLGTQNDEVDTFVLNGGKLDLALFGAGSGTGKKIVKLNGGTVVAKARTESSPPTFPATVRSGVERVYQTQKEGVWVDVGRAFEPVEIGGPVSFRQTDADVAFDFAPGMKVTYPDAVINADGPGSLRFRSAPEGDYAIRLANGAKMELGFSDVKDVKSVTIGNRLRPAGDYGEGGLKPKRFPGGGVFRALEGGDPSGMLLLVR